MNTSGSSPSAPPGRFTFRKAERLCSRRLLGELFKQGTAFNTYPLRFVVWRTGAGTPVYGNAAAPSEADALPGSASIATDAQGSEPPSSRKRTAGNQKPEPLQVVLSVSKRHFKRAHDRNRIKRLLREAWRHHKPILLTTLAERFPSPETPPATGASPQPPATTLRPFEPLLVAVLYIGKEKPESLVVLSRRLRKGLTRLLAELPSAPLPSAA